MNTDEAFGVITRVLAQIAPEVDLATVAPNADLQEELDLDSMDFLNFVTGIPEETSIEVPERDYLVLQSLEGCTRYLVQHSAGPAEAAAHSTSIGPATASDRLVRQQHGSTTERRLTFDQHDGSGAASSSCISAPPVARTALTQRS